MILNSVLEWLCREQQGTWLAVRSPTKRCSLTLNYLLRRMEMSLRPVLDSMQTGQPKGRDSKTSWV